MKNNRVDDVKSYNIIDSGPSEILDDITKIASLLFDMPIFLITILDEKKQWFLSSVGLDIKSTDIAHSFCQYALDNPNEVLIVNNSHKDERFRDNPFVINKPNVKFFAGAPLKTSNGNVLGTLCVIDTNPREFTENQKESLQILAKKVMVYINNYKTIRTQNNKIALNSLNLQKITNEVPVGIYQLIISEDGNVNVSFLSKEIYSLYPNMDIDQLKERPWGFFRYVKTCDMATLQSTWINANQKKCNWEGEFRTIDNKWHYTKAVPEVLDNGTIIWYGYIKDISQRMEYQNTLEEILFDISHVLRKPVANLKGLTQILQEEILDKNQLIEISNHINIVSEELELFTERLNEVYQKKHSDLIN